MKLEGLIYCEGPDCDHHQRIGVSNMAADRLPVGWVRAVEYGDTGPSDTAYCGWNCVLKAASTIPPPETIPFHDE